MDLFHQDVLSGVGAIAIGSGKRTAAAAINAFIGPATASYVTDLDGGLKARGYANPLLIMQAAGGGTTLSQRLGRTGLSLPPWEPSTQEFDVAPDGLEIAITADLADEPGMLHRTDVVTIDLATRRRRVLTAATGRSDGAPRYSPDGRVIAYTSHDTERSHVDQGHLELVARRGGPVRGNASR